jgi:hypothetical protein
VECIEYRCPWGCRRDAHTCARDLPPVCITKLTDIIEEDNVQGADQGFRLIVVKVFALLFSKIQ